MFFSSTFLLVPLMNLWIHHSATVSAEQCTDSPVFTPPSLVVRYGQPASASCSVCNTDCIDTVFGLESALGTKKENGTNILWDVDSLTEWDTWLSCYYNNKNGQQCETRLNITLYQPPGSVSIRFGHGDRPMLAGQSYTLECVVQKVAPVKNLKVTFYKGQEALAQKNSATGEEKPVDEIFNFSFRATEEDDGAMFWCHAQLDLEMQQAPPAALSQHLQATVYYMPRFISQSSPGTITVMKGDPLKLNCSAVGQPSPSYVWTHLDDARSLSNTGVYSIESVSLGDKGLYTCTVHNSMGTVTVNFNVEVKEDHIQVIIVVVIAVLVPLFIVGFIIFYIYRKRNHAGHYNLHRNINCCKKHSPVPTSA